MKGLNMLSRRRFIDISGKSLIGIGTLPILTTNLNASTTEASKKYSKHITILHTNDQHSRIDPFPSNDKKYPNQGGVAVRKTLIDNIRKENPNTILLDAGDIIQGTPYFNFYNGELEFSLMNKLNYAAATIGNHDFDAGIDRLSELVDLADFEMLNCNYDFSDTVLYDKIKPYKVFEIDELKIGVLGVGVELDGLVPPSLYKNTIYNDPITAVNKYASILKNDLKCDFVILLSHLGLEYKKNKVSDMNLSAKSQNIDLVLGGHTHSFLEKPRIVENLNREKVVINQVGWAGLFLGRIDLFFTESRKEKRIISKTLNI